MNYLEIDGIRYRLVPEDAEGSGEGKGAKLRLGDVRDGEVCNIAGREYIVCEHTNEGVVLLMKDCLYESEEFGSSNNYNGSKVDKLCEQFADELEKAIGAENIILHTVDLTADDGLKDYGSIERRVSLFTANQYRKYCDILDKYRLNIWTWTATAYSTPKHDDDAWVKCVAPAGYVGSNGHDDRYGVRPFLIFNSSISVSCEE